MWLILLAPIFSVLANPRLLREGYSRRLTSLVTTEYTLQVSPILSHSVVYFPEIHEVSAHLTKRLAEKVSKGEKLFDLSSSTITCAWGEGPDYWRFFPVFKAAVFAGMGPQSFANHCYQKVTVEISSITETSVEFSIESFDPTDLCYDTYLVSILNRGHIFVVDFFGAKKILFENLSSTEIFDIQTNGVRIFTFCDGIEDLISDIMMTVQLFFGGFGLDPLIPIFGSHTMREEEMANVRFIAKAMGYDIQERSKDKLNIDINTIKSGDFLAVMRLDGLAEIIMFGTGGKFGHSTMALWAEENGTRELYILESQGGWYWPVSGIQKTPYSKWIKLASNASYSVIVLPLKDEIRALFDEQAVWDWFRTVEGMPYGYHNFAFGWIDTVSDNFPPILDYQFFPVALGIAETVLPKAIANVYGAAMNMRLGTVNLTIPELEVVAGQQGRSLLDVQTDVEMEGWWYANGYSYVCSSFVLACYKRAGILGSYTLQATEFTPKDVYSLNIFNKSPVLPEVCLQADPMLPYCQILGKYRITLGSEYSSLSPYDNMNEKCPSVAPDYFRPDGC